MTAVKADPPGPKPTKGPGTPPAAASARCSATPGSAGSVGGAPGRHSTAGFGTGAIAPVGGWGGLGATPAGGQPPQVGQFASPVPFPAAFGDAHAFQPPSAFSGRQPAPAGRHAGAPATPYYESRGGALLSSPTSTSLTPLMQRQHLASPPPLPSGAAEMGPAAGLAPGFAIAGGAGAGAAFSGAAEGRRGSAGGAAAAGGGGGGRSWARLTLPFAQRLLLPSGDGAAGGAASQPAGGASAGGGASGGEQSGKAAAAAAADGLEGVEAVPLRFGRDDRLAEVRSMLGAPFCNLLRWLPIDISFVVRLDRPAFTISWSRSTAHPVPLAFA